MAALTFLGSSPSDPNPSDFLGVRPCDRAFSDHDPSATCDACQISRLEGPRRREKRRLLNFVLSNCAWEDGEVAVTFRQPFDMLAETTMAAASVEAGEQVKSAISEIWLGDLDSNQD
jgi:hypothetical protein